jgi:hypothetical protein
MASSIMDDTNRPVTAGTDSTEVVVEDIPSDEDVYSSNYESDVTENEDGNCDDECRRGGSDCDIIRSQTAKSKKSLRARTAVAKSSKRIRQG